jgi:phosphoenolpyruvate-protein phosphotransferase (PTS system enzyme I)
MVEQTARKEIIIKGIPASHGIAIGKAYFFLKDIPAVQELSIAEGKTIIEILRLDRALEKSAKELNKIHLFAQEKIGVAKAKILEAQMMVLEDQVLIGAIKKRIETERKNAEFIVSDEIGKYCSLMLKSQDEYMHERAHDMEDLKNRIVRNLQQERLVSKLEDSLIVVAHSLTPADTMILSRNHVLGYATDLGGITSHAALFSRSLKIPAVVGAGTVSREIVTGDTVILDGYSGTIILRPTPEHIAEYERKHEKMLKFEKKLEDLKDLPAETKDGHKIELSANIELLDELDYVVVQGSQGVGLYRTESLLLGRDDFPSEEEQVVEYTKFAERIYPHRIIIRTFDIGGDKIAAETAEESNPFLGWRGIRVGLDRPELLLAQIRAILRASTRKNVCIMFPMVTTLAEVRKAKELVRRAKAELRAQNIKFHDKLPIGVMIEVPAAALMVSQIAAEVNFLSVGSNDLTQYMLAVDRGNVFVSKLYREFEPAVLLTLRHVIKGGHKQGIWVGICGEMAGHPLAVPLLVGLGMDELSVVPAILPEVKKIIRSLTFTEMQEITTKALTLSTSDEIEKLMHRFFRKHFPDIPIEQE